MTDETETQKRQHESYERFMQQRKSIEANLAGIKRVIAVYSAKGGVGKTTIAVNTAVALARNGRKVGLLDADIDCPNATVLLGCNERASTDGKRILPPQAHGVKIVSMDALQGREEKARVWRGAMLTNMLTEILATTYWGELDLLVVDFPPGTSDAPLTMMQLVPLKGILIVTTPQKLACLDALRSGNMAKEMGQNIIGVVENMAGGSFGGSENARELAEKLGTKVIASIPLDSKISESGDEGVPAALREDYADAFKTIVDALEKPSKPAGLRVIT
ncbi:hypothetical protein AUJ14_00760 [Candidatus Micrarchaeota archaeon CG1_02_55_22]|nr:MAG: hypothetical protein AUJ14_00760 [Candidatus Micrarchaeota archaeon CG1_02_55_22]